MVVIEPARATAGAGDPVDAVAVAHTYAGVRTINGRAEDLMIPAEPGASVRLRVVNTDNGTLTVWSGEPVTVAAVDGNEVRSPAPVRDEQVAVAAGADHLVVAVRPPVPSGAAVEATAVVIG